MFKPLAMKYVELSLLKDWAGVANSYYWIDPAKGVAGVYATQILPFFDEKSAPTFQAFETEVYRAI